MCHGAGVEWLTYQLLHIGIHSSSECAIITDISDGGRRRMAAASRGISKRGTHTAPRTERAVDGSAGVPRRAASEIGSLASAPSVRELRR